MSRSRILVVEDNPKNLKLVRDVLTNFGYEVIEATSGEDGVRLAHERSPDLILMDLQLPGIDGAEALRQIRLRENDQVPVVAVTAFAMNDDRTRAFARTPSSASLTSSPRGTRSWRRGSPTRCPRSSGWVGCGASSLPNWPS